MKIAIISTYAPKGSVHSDAGGVASYTKNLTMSIRRSETDQIIVICNKVGIEREEYQEDGLSIVRCFDKNTRCFFQIYQEIKRIKPDVIHVQQELGLYGSILNAYLLQWFLFILRRYRTIITLHGVVSLKSINKKFIKGNNASLPVWLTKLAFYIIYRPLCVWANKVVVHEQIFKDILINEYRIKDERIEIIAHGVERLELVDRTLARSTLDITVEKRVVLFMGYLTGYKGIDLLIEGFSEYQKIDQSAFLVIGAGKHPKFKLDPIYLAEYQRLIAKAKELIPATRYRWNGFIEEKDIQLYYSASDVTVFPYMDHISSSGPMALSIGYGVPFLASDVFAEYVRNPSLCFLRTKESFSSRLQVFFERPDSERVYFEKMRCEMLWESVAKTHKSLYMFLYEENV